MGEHKFEVGMRVRRTLVDASTLVPAGTLGSVVQMRGSLPCITWDGFPGVGVPYHDPACVEPAADPPSVGVPGQGIVVQSVLIPPAGLGPPTIGALHPISCDCGTCSTSYRNGAPPGDWVSREEYAALDAKLKQMTGWRDDIVRRYGSSLADAQGERDRLRREKADLETQVAYLTRELVLAKARAKGAR